jgi:glycosyltransferase involved in cell wall biosynthesis
MILPSCSEAGVASAVEAMHAGLIPILTYETGVDVGDFGILLKSEAIDHIRAAVMTIAELPASEVEQRARAAWEHARTNHTRPLFVEAFRDIVREVAGRPASKLVP